MAWRLRSKSISTYMATSESINAQSPRTAPTGMAQLVWAEHLGQYFAFASGTRYMTHGEEDLADWDFWLGSYLNALAYLPGENLLVLGSGTTVSTSADGQVDTERLTTGATVTRLTYLPATGQMFCLTSSSTIYYSTDGITWGSADCGIIPNAICYANGLYIVGGEVNKIGMLSTSPDLATWTSRTLPLTNYPVYDFAVSAAGTILAAADIYTYRSTDGITWANSGSAGRYVAYSPTEDLFFAVRSNDSRFHLLATSPDATTWTIRSPWIGGQGTPAQIDYFPSRGEIVIISSSGIATTVDGTTYKNPALVNGLLVFSVAFRDSQAFTVPAGWVEVQQQNSGNISTTTSSSIGSGLIAYHVIADGTLPEYTDAVFARSLGNIAMATLVAYTNDGLAELDASVSATLAANSTTVSCAGVTTTEADTLMVGVAALADNTTASNMRATNENTLYSNNNSYNDPSVVWQRRAGANTAIGSDTGLYVWDCVKPSASSTGTVQYTSGNSSKHVILVAAFKLTPPSIPTITSVTVDQLTSVGGRVSAYLQF